MIGQLIQMHRAKEIYPKQVGMYLNRFEINILDLDSVWETKLILIEGKNLCCECFTFNTY